jgi:hypothetical protein
MSYDTYRHTVLPPHSVTATQCYRHTVSPPHSVTIRYIAVSLYRSFTANFVYEYNLQFQTKNTLR